MRRALALLLATSLAAGALAVGTVTSATAAVGDPTMDGPSDVFVGGNSITVSGTDPNNVGGAVELALNMAPQGTAAVQPDGTWSGQIDLTGVVDDRYQVTVYASTTALYKSVWVNRDTSSLQISSPTAATTIKVSAGGCIPLAATLNAPGATIDTNFMYGFLSTGGNKAEVRVNLDGTTATACVPVKDVPNGAATLWLQLGGEGRSYLARVQFALALASQVTASAFAGSGGVVLVGSVTEPGPDTVLTSSLDGGEPTPVDLRQASNVPQVTTPWTFTHYDEAWVINDLGMPYLDRGVGDGPH